MSALTSSEEMCKCLFKSSGLMLFAALVAAMAVCARRRSGSISVRPSRRARRWRRRGTACGAARAGFYEGESITTERARSAQLRMTDGALMSVRGDTESSWKSSL